jgi:hypothetical protein
MQNETPVNGSGESAASTYNVQVNAQSNQTLNLNHGLHFPPPDHIHVLEEYCPGFVERVVEAWQKQVAHRQALENKQLDEEYSAKTHQDDLLHEYLMKGLHMEHERIKPFAWTMPFLMAALVIAGIVFFALDWNVAGAACVGLFALNGVASVINSLKSRK